MADYFEPRQTQPECLIVANGPSIVGRAWPAVPRERVFLMGVNQSWRVIPDADGHVAIDADQYAMEGALPYYERVAAAGLLFHTGSGGNLGVRLDRHDDLTWGRHPFRKRHRGASTGKRPKPPLQEDGGVALKAGHDSGGSSAFIAAQIAAAMPFELIWIVGLDGGAEPKKFTGEKSNCRSHYRLWQQVPSDVRKRVRVIRPSLTGETANLVLADWPWAL